MNVPSEAELMALWEEGGFEAIQAHATAAADRDAQQILTEAFLNQTTRKGPTNENRHNVSETQ